MSKLDFTTCGIYAAVLHYADSNKFLGIPDGSNKSKPILASATSICVENMTDNYVPPPLDIIEHEAAVKLICGSHGASLEAAANRFPRPGGHLCADGPRTVGHADGNIKAFSDGMSNAVWSDLKAQGFLPNEAPASTD